MTIAAVLLVLLLQSPQVHIREAESAYEEGRQAQADHQLQKAAECFQKAIDIEPTFLDAREALIDTYLNSGDELNAAAAITRFLEIAPDATRYRLRLGSILLNQKQPERALAQFSLVLKREPLNADGLLGFAAAARQLGMNDRAEAALERGRKKYPSDERFRSAPPKTSSGAPQ